MEKIMLLEGGGTNLKKNLKGLFEIVDYSFWINPLMAQ